MNTTCTHQQKIENAKRRILEFDDQIDGANKIRLAHASFVKPDPILKQNILRARHYLIVKRGEMVQFLFQHNASIPTRGI